MTRYLAPFTASVITEAERVAWNAALCSMNPAAIERIKASILSSITRRTWQASRNAALLNQPKSAREWDRPDFHQGMNLRQDAAEFGVLFDL
jgi:hypothetical protein